MKKLICGLSLAIGLSLSCHAQGVKISAYPNTNNLAGTNLFLIAIVGSPGTNMNISYAQLSNLLAAAIGGGSGGVQVWTNNGSAATLLDPRITGVISKQSNWIGYDIQPSDIYSSTHTIGIGYRAFENELLSGADVISIGYQNIAESICTNAADVIAIGDYNLSDGIFDSVSDFICLGDSLSSGASTAITNVDSVVLIGKNVMNQSVLTNSSKVIAIGATIANTALDGSWKKLVMIGSDIVIPTGIVSNSVAIGGGISITGNNQAVIGSNLELILSCSTNHIKFGSSNDPPASTASPVKWISVQIGSDTNAYRLPLYE